MGIPSLKVAERNAMKYFGPTSDAYGAYLFSLLRGSARNLQYTICSNSIETEMETYSGIRVLRRRFLVQTNISRIFSASCRQTRALCSATQYVYAFISRRSRISYRKLNINNIVWPIFPVKFNLFYNFSALRSVYWMKCEVENYDINMFAAVCAHQESAKICAAFTPTMHTHASVSLIRYMH